MRHPDGPALFDWDLYNITETANFMLRWQEAHILHSQESGPNDSLPSAVLHAHTTAQDNQVFNRIQQSPQPTTHRYSWPPLSDKCLAAK
jgi:hypothetical protein